MLQRLAVYCGARAGLDPSYTSMATDFGHQMAEHGVSLVYGGAALAWWEPSPTLF